MIGVKPLLAAVVVVGAIMFYASCTHMFSLHRAFCMVEIPPPSEAVSQCNIQ
jgi:hypothetical protein